MPNPRELAAHFNWNYQEFREISRAMWLSPLSAIKQNYDVILADAVKALRDANKEINTKTIYQEITRRIDATAEDRYGAVLYYLRYHFSEIPINKETLIKINGIINLDRDVILANRYRVEEINIGHKFIGLKPEMAAELTNELLSHVNDEQEQTKYRQTALVYNIYLMAQLFAFQSFKNANTKTAFAFFALLNLKSDIKIFEALDLYKFAKYNTHRVNYLNSLHSWLAKWELNGYRVGKQSVLFYLALIAEEYLELFDILLAVKDDFFATVTNIELREYVKSMYHALDELAPEIKKITDDTELLLMRYASAENKAWKQETARLNKTERIRDYQAHLGRYRDGENNTDFSAWVKDFLTENPELAETVHEDIAATEQKLYNEIKPVKTTPKKRGLKR